MDLIEQIKKEAEGFLKNVKGSHKWDHVERVYNLCLHLGKKEKAKMDILQMAAYLHDIGRRKEYETRGKVHHAAVSAKLARRILEKHKLDEKKIKAVIHCIASHSFRSGAENIPKSKEAKILFDADKLDAIGAVGIGRDFLFAGEIGSKLHNSKGIDVEENAAYSMEDTAYREFVVKLSKIKNKMFTREGKRIAAGRHQFMVDFFNRFQKEIDGEL